MKIHEYQAKELLGAYGVPVPGGEVAETPEEVFEAAKAYDKCVIKAGARLENVICDRSVTVTPDTVICGTPESPCILPKGGVI